MVDQFVAPRKMIVCHACGEPGHKSFNCPRTMQDVKHKETEFKPMMVDRKVKGVVTCDFQQCGILTSVDSNEPVQPPVKLRNSK